MYQDILTIAVVTVFAFFAIYWMWFQGVVVGCCFFVLFFLLL